jgi:transposase
MRKEQEPEPAEPLQVVRPNAAGIDVGAAEVYVAVPAGRDAAAVRHFGTYTPELEALADWLVTCRVDTVALESTGVYWVPLHEVLSARGIQVCVVNAKHLRHVPGRKSDVQDCQWLQRLHTYGLLRGSFRPADDMLTLRTYLRQRTNLIEGRATHIHRMQKYLTLMNVRLPEVVSDITGVTGMRILRAIVAGEHDPLKLAVFREPTCKHSQTDFVQALTGHYRAEELFALGQELALYDAYTQQIAACDAAIERQFAVTRPARGGDADADAHDLPPLGPTRKANTHSKNAPAYDARAALYRLTGVDLTEVDGLNASTAQTFLSEVGLDMGRWPTAKHFCSWLGLAPRQDISGGKVLRAAVLKVHNRAAQALRLAAQAVARTDTALGAFFRRIRARRGPEQAVVATAHKLACILYHMLKEHQPFRAVSAGEYDQAQQARALKALQRQAKRLGYTVVAQPEAPPA